MNTRKTTICPLFAVLPLLLAFTFIGCGEPEKLTSSGLTRVEAIDKTVHAKKQMDYDYEMWSIQTKAAREYGVSTDSESVTQAEQRWSASKAKYDAIHAETLMAFPDVESIIYQLSTL